MIAFNSQSWSGDVYKRQINVREICLISNIIIKFIKKLQKFVTVHSVLSLSLIHI